MIHGILPPLTTPFINGEIAFNKFQENIQKLSSTGLSGFVVLGSNGETAYLTRDEKLALIRAAREVVPRDKSLVAGTGVDSIKETIFLTNEAAKIGADAGLIITPSFFKGAMNHDALCNYYQTVADAVDISVFIYNVPKFTGVDIEPETVAALAQHPNIIGLKNSSENMARLAEMVYLTPDDFTVLAGTASVLYPGLCLGAAGGVLALANIAPSKCVEIQTSFENGDLEKALSLQQRMIAVNKAVTAKYGVRGLKAAMDMLGYFGGNPRAPLSPLNPEGVSDLKSILKKAKLL